MELAVKRIALLCNYELLPDRVGGMDYFFWSFDKKCRENNIQVDWFFPNLSDHGEYGMLTIISSSSQNTEQYFLAYLRQTNQEYSFIFTHFVELCGPFFYNAKKLSGAKIICVDHNPRPLAGYSLKKKIQKRLKGLLYSQYVDLFVGVSSYTVNEILNDFGSFIKRKAIVIYNGVVIDDIHQRQSRSSQMPVFMVASHLRESKGIQDLIEAVSKLPSSIKKDLVIDLYGDGPYRKTLEEKVQSKQLKTIFRFMGSHSNLNEVYCLYDYMLQPTHMECFSLSILESLAANVPVITTKVGGNEEVIVNNRNGYLFHAMDVDSLAELIKKVYLGELEISGNTRSLIEKDFSLSQMVDNHFKLLST